MTPVNLSSESIQHWLAQFSGHEAFAGLLALVAHEAIYVVDKNQKIIFWGAGAEKLSGLNGLEVINNPCPPGYEIEEPNTTDLNNQTIITAPRTDLQLRKTIQALRDQSGGFAGGLGLLTPCTEPPETDSGSIAGSQVKQNFHGILSRSPAMRAVFQIIENAAETAATVLVRGESGSGKELVARAIHQLSSRHAAPFLAINCAALSSSLLESELFGHVRGAFTGAIKDHRGLFQRAHGGTLFLDEVAEMPLDLQAKLLRVIQERNYIPVGGDHAINVDVRLVAATHRSLRELVKTGEFREDLMYRLRVVPIFIPPLRERREDISLLLWHFIQLHNAEYARKIDKIEPQAMRTLLDYGWPGNVRELHNVIEYTFAVGRGTTLRWSELPPEFRETKVAVNRASLTLIPELEENAIRQALQQHNGAITEAAQALGMSRATFWRKRKAYGI